LRYTWNRTLELYPDPKPIQPMTETSMTPTECGQAADPYDLEECGQVADSAALEECGQAADPDNSGEPGQAAGPKLCRKPACKVLGKARMKKRERREPCPKNSEP